MHSHRDRRQGFHPLAIVRGLRLSVAAGIARGSRRGPAELMSGRGAGAHGRSPGRTGGGRIRRAGAVLIVMIGASHAAGSAMAVTWVPMQVVVEATSVVAVGPGAVVTRIHATSGAVLGRVPVPARVAVTDVIAHGERLWLLGWVGRASWLGVLDRKTLMTTGAWRFGGDLGGLAAAGGSVWSVSQPHGEPVRLGADGSRVRSGIRGVLALAGRAHGGLWAVQQRRAGGKATCSVLVLNGRTGAVQRRFGVPCRPTGVVEEGTSLWVLYGGGNRVTRIDPDSTAVPPPTRIGSVAFPIAGAASPDALFVVSDYTLAVHRLAPWQQGIRSDVVAVTPPPVGIGSGPAGVWAASSASGGVLTHLSPEGRVVNRFHLS